MAHGAGELLDLYIRRQKIGLEFKFEKEIKLRQILVKVERFWNEQCTFSLLLEINIFKDFLLLVVHFAMLTNTLEFVTFLMKAHKGKNADQ